MPPYRIKSGGTELEEETTSLLRFDPQSLFSFSVELRTQCSSILALSLLGTEELPIERRALLKVASSEGAPNLKEERYLAPEEVVSKLAFSKHLPLSSKYQK